MPDTAIFSEVWHDWEISKTKMDSSLGTMNLYFLNEKIGYSAGGRGLYKTIDAGQSWQKININSILPPTNVFFVNEQIGFAGTMAFSSCQEEDCKKGAGLFKTIDGGKTWSKTFFKEYYYIYSLRFINEKVGFAIGEPIFDFLQLLKTEDGGETWNVAARGLGTTQNVTPFSTIDSTVFHLTYKNTIMKSPNAGKTWREVGSIAPDVYLGMHFTDTKTGYIYSVSKMNKTIDGGASWQTIDFPYNKSYPLLNFINNQEIVGISSSENGQFGFTTSDGGITWKKANATYPALKIQYYHFPTNNVGFGSNGNNFYVMRKKSSPTHQ